jgi:two-component system, NarL family, invasion response regulator UvrY
MIRVIIVDDHPIIRRGLKQIIGAEPNMQVVGEAQDAREAIQIIRRTACDAIILDIALPGANGLTVLDELKSDRRRPPVLIMSMYEEEQYAVRALKAGAAGYLMKDSLPEELIKAIRKIASGGKYVSPSLAEKLASELISPTAPHHDALSDREFQILCLIASGKSLKKIGEALCISGKTVSTYRARILEKMCMSSNSDLTRYALEHRLV